VTDGESVTSKVVREPDPAMVALAALWRDFYRTHAPFFAEKCPDGVWRIFAWERPDEAAAIALSTLTLRNEREARKAARELCEMTLVIEETKETYRT
jgi:hypothetical protein